MISWPELAVETREPLRLIEPFPWGRVVVLTVLTGTVLWLAGRVVLRWLRAPRTGKVEVPVAPLDPFEEALIRLRKRTRESLDYRRGCHELARLVREDYAARRGGQVETWTAAESVRMHADDAGAVLLQQIAGTRFGRRPPVAATFDALCELALETWQALRS